MENYVLHMFIMFPLEIWNLPLHWLCVCSWSIPRSQKAPVWFKTLPFSYSRKPPRMMCFIPIHLERSTLTLHILSLIFYPCCCCLTHIPNTIRMLHPLHGLVEIFNSSRKTISTTRVSKKWSKRTNWFSSSFVWNRMRVWHGNSFAPRTRRVVNWDGRLGNLTVCGLRVLGMSFSWILAFLLCTRITKACTRETRGRKQCGFTTLEFYNSFTQSLLKSKMWHFFTTVIHRLFVSSPLTNSKNIQSSLNNFPIIVGRGWGETLAIKWCLQLYICQCFLSVCAG